MSELQKEFHPGDVPQTPGVYVFRDRFAKVIYVGKAVNLRRRLSQYFQPSRTRYADAKLRSLINTIADWDFYPVRTENEALILESRLIKEYAPYYNILMRDDKRYLMLKINLNEPFPTLTLARVRKDDRYRYFGPFPNGGALKSTLEFLLSHFGLRACRTAQPDDETRKRCLKRIVKDCCAPCTGQVTPEEYRQKVDQMLSVLNGNLKELSAILQQRMKEAAAAQRFEKAAHWRDVLTNLETVFGEKNRSFSRAFLPVESGEAAVLALQEALRLPKPPRHMECFDISNILGTLAVGSMVCFENGKPARDQYRRFRIKTVHQSDDFAMMHEVITRRYKRCLEENRPLPDLLVVDGGKGQLSSAIAALVECGCPPFPVIGLAKQQEEIFVPGRSQSVRLDRHNPALRMLQAMRDEAHRFAIGYHRELRNKRLQQSLLDEIEGIGPQRKKQLLETFGSVRELRKASVAEVVQKVPGIGETFAAKVLAQLNRKAPPRTQPPATKPEPPAAAPSQ